MNLQGMITHDVQVKELLCSAARVYTAFQAGPGCTEDQRCHASLLSAWATYIISQLGCSPANCLKRLSSRAEEQTDSNDTALARLERRLWAAAGGAQPTSAAQALVQQALFGHHFALLADVLLSGVPLLLSRLYRGRQDEAELKEEILVNH